jgi:hypothetical protein
MAKKTAKKRVELKSLPARKKKAGPTAEESKYIKGGRPLVWKDS